MPAVPRALKYIIHPALHRLYISAVPFPGSYNHREYEGTKNGRILLVVTWSARHSQPLDHSPD